MSDLWPVKTITACEQLSSTPTNDITPCHPDDRVANDHDRSPEDQLPIDFSLKKESMPDLPFLRKPSKDESTAMCNYYQTSVSVLAAQPAGQHSLIPYCEQLSVKCECDSQYSIKSEEIYNLKWEDSTCYHIPQINDYSSAWRNNQYHPHPYSNPIQHPHNQRVFDVSSNPFIKREPTTEPKFPNVSGITLKEIQNSNLQPALQFNRESGVTCTIPVKDPGFKQIQNSSLQPALQLNGGSKGTCTIPLTYPGFKQIQNSSLQPALQLNGGSKGTCTISVTEPGFKQIQNSSLQPTWKLGEESVSGTCPVSLTDTGASVFEQKLELYPFWIRPFDTSLKMNRPVDLPSLNMRCTDLIPQEFTITNMIGLPLSCTTRKRPRLLAPKVEDNFVKPDNNMLPFQNVKKYNRSNKSRLPLQSIQNLVNQSKRERGPNVYIKKKVKKIKSKIAARRKENAKKELSKPTKSRKPLKSIRSAERCDPNFKGAIVCLKTQVKDKTCYLDISASFCNIKSTRSCGLTKKPWYGSGSLASIQEPGHMSDEEGINITHPGFYYSNDNGSKVCASCATRRTPLWRDAEDGTPLCNACGIRFKKYRVRCSKCWHIPKKDIKTYPNCPQCGSSLRMSFGKKCSW